MNTPDTIRGADLHWEVSEAIPRDRFDAVLHEGLERLQADERCKACILEVRPGLCRMHSAEQWEFGFSDAGGMRESDLRGGGIVHHAHGLLPRLMLRFLQQQFRQVLLCDERATLLTPRLARDDVVFGAHLFAFDQVIELGARLGLCLGRINLLAMDEATDAPLSF